MRKLSTLIVLAVLLAALPTLNHAYPGTCSPATDYLTCIQCAGQMYDQCYATCGLAFKCKQDCGETLRQDYDDCRDHFGSDPLYI